MELKKFNLNTKQGKRDRDLLACVVFNGEVFRLDTTHFNTGMEDFLHVHEAKVGVVKELKFTRDGKWSNADLRVVLVEGAKLVAFKRPFNGWAEDKQLVLAHVLEDTKAHGGALDLTKEEAWLALKAVQPKVAAKLQELEDLEAELLAAFNPFVGLENKFQ